MDEMLVKPMNIMNLLRQIEALLVTHEDKKQKALTRHGRLAHLQNREGARSSARTEKRRNGT